MRVSTPFAAAIAGAAIRVAGLILLFAAIATTGATTGARAHEMRPAIVDIVVGGDRQITVDIRTNAEALISGIAEGHTKDAPTPNAVRYEHLRTLGATELSVEMAAFWPELIEGIELRLGSRTIPLSVSGFRAPAPGDATEPRLSWIILSGTLPQGEGALTWRYSESFGDSVIRAYGPDRSEAVYTQFVTAGAVSDPFVIDAANATSSLRVLTQYVEVGFVHIVPRGLDHILFVVGLFLLAAGTRALLIQVTMFTLAHSVTLALGLLDIVRLPASIVEPLIAASIVYIAIDNLMGDRLAPMRRWVVFFFGLLHGLGFAGVLGEYGLPAGHFAPALIGFNVGVELGQLAVIAACFLTIGLWSHGRQWRERAVTVAGSLSIGAVAAFWCVERISAYI